MINIQLKEVGIPIRDKIEKIRLYRLNLLIQNDIDEYFDDYTKFNSRFIFRIVKEDISKILDKHDIKYKFDYEYDKKYDNVKVFIGKNYILDIKIVTDSEFHI